MPKRCHTIMHINKAADGSLHLIRPVGLHVDYSDWVKSIALVDEAAAADLSLPDDMLLEAAETELPHIKQMAA